MNKAELIDSLTEKLGTDRRTTTAVVEGFVDAVVRAVHRGESVTITGFGVFEKRERAPRVARNPRTGETVRVEATQVPSFRPGAQFKALVAGTQELSPTGVAVKRGSGAPTLPPSAESPRPADASPPAKRTAKRPARSSSPQADGATAAKSARKRPAAKTAATKTPAAKQPAKKSATKQPAKKSATKQPAQKQPAQKRAGRGAAKSARS